VVSVMAEDSSAARASLSVWFALDERVRYLVVGGWNTLFGYLVYVALVTLFGRAAYVWMLVPATVVGITQNFFVYKYLVFQTRGGHFREYLKFYVVYGPVLLVNLFALPFLVRVTGLDPRIAQGAFAVIAVVVTYLGNKYFTFGRAGSGAAKRAERAEAAERPGEPAERPDGGTP
jgi:putative flippase GtrA